jgi:hypothetical protein
MKMSELAQKKLDRFIGADQCEREDEFITEFIYGAKPPIQRNFGVTFDNFLPVVTRCHKAGGRVIGVEIHIESVYPHFVYTWEEYGEVYDPEWVLHVWLDLIANQVTKHIVPVMDFPVRILDENL